MITPDIPTIIAGLSAAQREAFLRLGDGVSSCDDGDYLDGVWQQLERKGLCSVSAWSGGWRVLPTELAVAAVRSALIERAAK